MRGWLVFVGAIAAAGVFAVGTPSVAHAQGKRGVPVDLYYQGFAPYFDGEFADAQRIFRDAAQAGHRVAEVRWIDSVCYHAMLGDALFHQGRLNEALDQYTSAIKLYLANRDWILRTEFDTPIEPFTPAVPPTWARSTRVTRLGRYPLNFSTLVGRFDNDKVFQQGGVVAPPEIYPVNVIEIMRCFSQAIRRRREILGPTCEHDPLTGQLAEAMARRPGQPNHWSQCWISLALGLSYASANKPAQAATELTESLLAGGQYEHALSGMALLELGKLAWEKGEQDTAAALFVEASLSAAAYDQYEVVEEALRWGATAWTVSGKPGVYPPLAQASAWAKQKHIRTLHVSLLTLAASGALEKGETAAALQLLTQAKASIGSANLPLSDYGARLNYAAARHAFQAGRLDAGTTALAAALKWQSAGSLRLYQMNLVDTLALSGQVPERVADLMYSNVLREPTPRDWLVDPQETLAVVGSPHGVVYEHWLEVALARKDIEKAATIADALRRHRFLSSQPLGGRLLALRWIMDAPPELLPNEAQLQRQALLVKFPKFEPLAKQAGELKHRLAKLTAADAERANVLLELAKVSTVQEVILREMALSREPTEFVFPPRIDVSTARKQLPAGTLVLSYLATTQRVHAFALTADRVGHWLVENPGKIKADTQEIYKAWGLFDRLQPVAAADLKDTAWRTPAERIAAALTNQMKPADWEKYQELVLIPDRTLWHLPWEALPAGSGSEEPLLFRVRMRYAPLLGLAFPDPRVTQRTPRLAVAVGLPNTRDTADRLQEAFDGMIAAPERAERWDKSLPAPSRFAALTCDRLLVLGDVEDAEKGAFDWSPLLIDRNKTTGQLEDWFTLPFGGPVEATFPTFHTAAESGLKKGGTGDEIFLTLCGLMSTGTRTVLLSRWRMGGQSSIDLVREYHQELGHASAASAWQRSVRLLRDKQLSTDSEPKVRGSRNDMLKGQHPLFWAGYLMADTGSDPAAAKQ